MNQPAPEVTRAERKEPMKLDQTLAREIKAANGDGSRSAKFALLRRVENARQEMSTPEIRVKFNEILRTHGRAVTAICVASTLWSRQERLESWGLPWAREVLLLWTTKPPSGISRATIDDGIHPTRICEYAAEFIKLTTEH
jgi:hypothetical protein